MKLRFRISVEKGWKGWGLMLRSGPSLGQAGPDCRLQIEGFNRYISIRLPPILKPHRWKQPASYWDADTIARIGRDWYWEYTERKFGFHLFESLVSVHWGRDENDRKKRQAWSWFLPWTCWRHWRYTTFGLDGTVAESVDKLPGGFIGFELWHALKGRCPSAAFAFLDYDGERIIATTRMAEDEYRRGEGRWKWLSWFSKPRTHRALDIGFSSEVGRKKGSWKGGTVGHGLELHSGELHEEGFRRYCREQNLTFIGRADEKAAA